MQQDNTTALFITRHGETAWNTEGRFQGRGDSPLTQKGLAQAKDLGRVLDEEKIDLILTSPLQRARETARLAKGSRDIPIRELKALAEMDLGRWEGAFLTELKEREPENYHNYWNDPFCFVPAGGESYRDLIARFEGAMREILEVGDGRRVLVVTHGMALMAILHLVSGRPLEEILRQPVLRQTSITRVLAGSSPDIRYEVLEVGSTAHFPVQEQAAPAEDEPLWEKAAELLLTQKLTISVAESLTGGLLCAFLLSSSRGISASFREGYVTYSNEAKIRDLGVRQETLERWGAVSEETAREMVLGCQEKSGTDIAIATTGIAGPGGATPAKPLGLTYIALAFRGKTAVYREIFPGGRNEVRQRAVDFALARLIEVLGG